MKKVLVIIMMMLATLASPLFAVDGSPPVMVSSKIVIAENEDGPSQNGIRKVVAARAGEKVSVLHKDTLMYSIGGSGGNKATKANSYKLGIDAVTSSAIILAAVSQSRI